MTEGALVPIEQKQVLFYDDELTAVMVELDGEETIYVPLRPICDYLGITYIGQRDRIQRNPVLADHLRGVSVTLTPAGGRQEMVCLALKYLPGWLFGISVNRIKPELQDKIIRYQRECYDVLWEAFREGRLTADNDFDSLLQQADSDVVQAYQIAQAVVKLARNQILLQSTVTNNTERIEQLEAALGDPKRHITPDQASQISQAVKTVAIAQGKVSGRNEFGGVYGELYRKFGITSYKLLPASRFEEAMKFLSDWHAEITGDSPF